MAGLVPAIHAFSVDRISERGCPAQGSTRPGMTDSGSGDAGPQQIVQVHDADRLAIVDHDRGGDLRGIEQLQRLARQLVGAQRLWRAGPDLLYPRAEPGPPHWSAA